LVDFLHDTSTAFLKIPEGLKIIPKYDLESKYMSMLPVKVQIKYAKALLGVNKQAVNLAVLGELGINSYMF
jgi:hypothetical protein